MIKPRFRVDEPVYVDMGGYKVKGVIKNIHMCRDCKGGVDREYFFYSVDDLEGHELYSTLGLVTDTLLVERWEPKMMERT